MRILNWEKFQHYKQRRPPWIRLYRSLLEDPDFMAQEDGAKALLCELWMIASDGMDGSLPAIPLLAWRLRRDVASVNSLLGKINPKFIELDCAVLAPKEQDALPEESREEERTETRKNQGRAVELPDGPPMKSMNGHAAERITATTLDIRTTPGKHNQENLKHILVAGTRVAVEREGYDPEATAIRLLMSASATPEGDIINSMNLCGISEAWCKVTLDRMVKLAHEEYGVDLWEVMG